MKKTSFLFSLCIVLVLPFTQAQKGHDIPQPYSGRSKITLQKNHRDTQLGFKSMLSEKWNDSIYQYNWNSGISDWSLNTREFRTRSLNGYISSRLYLTLDTVTHQWVNSMLDEMGYFGSSGDILMNSSKEWDPVTSSWIQYSFEHFLTPGNEDEYFFKNWNFVTRKYEYGYRYTFQYDTIGNQTEEIDQDLDTTSLLWVNTYKYFAMYNSASKIVVALTLTWDTTSLTWTTIGKTEFAYDTSNFLTETLRSSWTGSSWNLYGRSIYTNNIAGLPVARVDESMNGASWDTNYMVQSTYDATNLLLLTQLDRSYVTATHTWTNRLNKTNTYFSNGKPLTTLSQIWNSVTNTWMNFSFKQNDTFGNAIDSYYISINSHTFVIDNGSRYLDSFDGNNRFIQRIQQDLNLATSLWEDASKILETYEDPINSYYILELGTLWNGTSWVNDYKDIFFWSYPNGIENVKKQTRLCFYENPMESGKPINCPFLDPSKSYQFDLFTMKGENVYSETVYSGTSFVINRSLSAGNYILRISENGKTVYRDKVIIRP